MANLQHHKLESGVKNATKVTLNLSSNKISDSNKETDFLHKLLLTDTQVSRIPKAFANGLSSNVKLSKIQLFKILQSRLFLPLPFIFPALKMGE